MRIGGDGVTEILDGRVGQSARRRPSTRRRREHRECDRTSRRAEATHHAGCRGDGGVDGRLLHARRSGRWAAAPGGAGVELADLIAGLGVGVAVLRQCEAARRHGLGHQRLHAPGRPRRRHLRRDDRAEVLLERHLVDGAVLAVRAVHGADRATVGTHPPAGLAHGDQVGRVGTGRGLGLRAHGHTGETGCHHRPLGQILGG